MHIKWTLIHLRGIRLFSDHVFKIKFGPLSNCSKNELWSTFDFRCNRWYESGAKFIFRAIWKWTKLHFKHVISEQPNASQVDQSSFGMHIQHVIWSPSHPLLDQNSYPRVLQISLCLSSLWFGSVRTPRIMNFTLEPDKALFTDSRLFFLLENSLFDVKTYDV